LIRCSWSGLTTPVKKLTGSLIHRHPDNSLFQGLPKFDYATLSRYDHNETLPAENITPEVGLNYKHTENDFPEFDREPLIPHMTSTEGPALAVADINHDGLEDVFMGAAKRTKPALFIQTITGRFIKMDEACIR
jgi:hypothetical protein